MYADTKRHWRKKLRATTIKRVGSGPFCYVPSSPSALSLSMCSKKSIRFSFSLFLPCLLSSSDKSIVVYGDENYTTNQWTKTHPYTEGESKSTGHYNRVREYKLKHPWSGIIANWIHYSRLSHAAKRLLLREMGTMEGKEQLKWNIKLEAMQTLCCKSEVEGCGNKKHSSKEQ